MINTGEMVVYRSTDVIYVWPINKKVVDVYTYIGTTLTFQSTFQFCQAPESVEQAIDWCAGRALLVSGTGEFA